MTWISDLSSCSDFPSSQDASILAIGWLDREHPFTTGLPNESVYQRLKQLFVDPWQPFVSLGFHECNLCVFDAEARGSANLFVPGKGRLYVCPKLILHYMNAHGYCPPDEFCEAVIACPDTRTMEYKRALLAAGGRSLMKNQE